MIVLSHDPLHYGIHRSRLSGSLWHSQRLRLRLRLWLHCAVGVRIPGQVGLPVLPVVLVQVPLALLFFRRHRGVMARSADVRVCVIVR